MRTIALLIFLVLAACSAPQPPLVASDVDITAPLPGRHMAAGYLVLTNTTDEAIHITSVTSPQFAAVEIHETTLEDGISRMRKLDKLVVPANGDVVLQRGGKHLMLMRAGDLSDSVSLQFFSNDLPILAVTHPVPGDS